MTTLPLHPTPSSGTRPLSAGPVALALVSRLVSFALLQVLVATVFAVRGHGTPWAASVPWWPVTVTVANLLGIALLSLLVRREGRRWSDLLHIERGSVRNDVLVTLGLLLIGGALAMGPNLGLATLLWGDPEIPLGVLVQPLPLWAAWVACLGFPLTIAFAELPTYYGYVRPRLESLGMHATAAVVVTASMHGLQHAALPLVLDVRFVLWRALMFLPFALFVGAALRWRPRLLPYLMLAHGLLDLTVGLMVLQASTG